MIWESKLGYDYKLHHFGNAVVGDSKKRKACKKSAT
jgi:hypothetical protein